MWRLSGQVRASDREREQVAEVLREHAAQGRLTPVEFDERIRAAYGAQTRAALQTLVGDLPVEVVFTSSPAARPERGGAGSGIPAAARRAGRFVVAALVAALLVAGVPSTSALLTALHMPQWYMFLELGLLVPVVMLWGVTPLARGLVCTARRRLYGADAAASGGGQ